MNLMSALETEFKIELDINDIVDFSSFEKREKNFKKIQS